MIKTLKYQYLAVIWALIVLVLCDMPFPSAGKVRFFDGFDKLVHTGFFFVFTVLLFFGNLRQYLSHTYRIIPIISIFSISALFGGLIELLQWKVFTYRSPDWWDFFADMTGTGMGIFSYIFLHRTSLSEKFIKSNSSDSPFGDNSFMRDIQEKL